ncbi:MAG: tRNA uridine-5-carboxymethylaminomethyl(34) synthesis GTPase MnmE [Lachnospiraceae bacterium]|nr:tRNA uridine-5-carboxymethylaminomethyl(34) synthesis GTPase MnmE [Lachnospiraceae bacterium]
MSDLYYNEDTIAAVSTGISPGGIGIVRISGPDAIAAADRLFFSRSGQKLANVKSHTIHYGTICEDGEMLDEVLVSVMRAPATYTREDIVEINCHGGIFVVRKVLRAVLRNGVRPAEPGEFTKRAFLNGRIDLTQAEAVMDLISADNEYAEKSAVSQLKGSVRDAVLSCREKILYETAYIEAALDDPEHYDLTGYGDELYSKLQPILRELESLYRTSDDGKIMREGIATVILGRPNVGKSTLMNVLSGTDTAIVTEIAGTTRDVLEETVSIGGLPLRIMDTAGIRTTEDVIEKIGVEKALKCAENADLILYVLDAASEFSQEDKDLLEQLSGRQMIVLLNKSDLKQRIKESDVSAVADAPVISVSAKENYGIGQLREYVLDLFLGGEVRFNEQVYITNERHKAALSDVIESLKLVLESIETGMPEDVFTVDLMDAYRSLGTIIGEEIGEDLINEIFSKFCMGK